MYRRWRSRKKTFCEPTRGGCLPRTTWLCRLYSSFNGARGFVRTCAACPGRKRTLTAHPRGAEEVGVRLAMQIEEPARSSPRAAACRANRSGRGSRACAAARGVSSGPPRQHRGLGKSHGANIWACVRIRTCVSSIAVVLASVWLRRALWATHQTEGETKQKKGRTLAAASGGGCVFVCLTMGRRVAVRARAGGVHAAPWARPAG